jgi:3-oxoacyl-ACP reductase-like protein
MNLGTCVFCQKSGSNVYFFSLQLRLHRSIHRQVSYTDVNMDTGDANLTVPNIFNFKDHVALVTGGSTGLGEMAAQGFIQNGATVIIASRKKSELEKTASRLNKLGPGKCHIVVADLKDKAGCDHLVKEVGKITDRLTVLLNNSGATW